MGQTPQNPLQAQLADFTTIHTDHEHNIKILKNSSTGEQRLIRKWIFNDQHHYDKIQEEHMEREKYCGQFLEKLIKYQGIVSEDLCTRSYEIYAIWEYQAWTLADQIQCRAKEKRPFTENQLLNIASNCIEALQQMQQKNHIHEKLTPHSIKLTRTGQTKISDPLSLPSAQNYSIAYRNLSMDRIYLSPQEVNSLEMQNLCVKSNKNDVWTFGMLLLEAALLEGVNDCYLEECRKINWAKLVEKLKKVQKKYGQNVKNLISAMLQQNKKSRSTWFQLRQYFAPRPLKASVMQLNQITNQPPRQSPQVLAYKSVYQDQSEIYSFAKPGAPSHVQKQNIVYNHHQQVPYVPGQQPVVWKENRPAVNFVGSGVGPIVPTYVPIQRSGVEANRNYPVLQAQPQVLASPYVPYISQIRTLNPPEVKKFVSPASIQGFLFQQSQVKTQKEVVIESSEQKPKIEDTRHQPLINCEYKQKIKPYNDIKNAQSITYEDNFQQIYSFVPSKQLVNMGKAQPLKQVTNKELQQEKLPMQTESLEEFKNEQQQQQQQDKIEYVIENFQVGSRYEGQKLRNMRHGQGKFYYQDGGMYDGHWQYNKMHGKGLLYYQSGALAYDGMWKNDQFEGKGKLYNETPEPLYESYNCRNFDNIGQTWQYYDGQFVNDMKQGRGKLMLTNGEYFVGNFNEDMISGVGKFFSKSGQIKGEWEANQLIRID